MNSADFIIIYLACGAPFGVYYLQNHSNRSSNHFWFKTFSAFVLWLPLAIYFFYKSRISVKVSDFSLNNAAFAEVQIEEKLYLTQREIEKSIFDSKSKISLFEFRQTTERYAGLAILQQIDTEEISEKEREIFRITATKNIDTAAICLRRRNRKMLTFHQTIARQDFLKIIENLFNSISNTKQFEISAIEFVSLLNDSTALENLKKLFAEDLQTETPQRVKQLEKVLWKTEIPEPLITKPITTRLPMTSVTMSLHSKD